MKTSISITKSIVLSFLCLSYVGLSSCGDQWNDDISWLLTPSSTTTEQFRISDIWGVGPVLYLIGGVFPERKTQNLESSWVHVGAEFNSLPSKMRILTIKDNKIETVDYDLDKYYKQYGKHIGSYTSFYFNDTSPKTVITAENVHKTVDICTTQYNYLIEPRGHSLKLEYSTTKPRTEAEFIVGDYDNHYWKCKDNSCTFFVKNKPGMLPETLIKWEGDKRYYVWPKMVSFDQKSYWAIYPDNIIKLISTGSSLKEIKSYIKHNDASANILNSYIFKTCVFYNDTHAILMGTKISHEKAPDDVQVARDIEQNEIFSVELISDHAYDLTPIETPQNIENIAVTKNIKDNTHTLHVLKKNAISSPIFSCPLEKLIDAKKEKLVQERKQQKKGAVVIAAAQKKAQETRSAILSPTSSASSMTTTTTLSAPPSASSAKTTTKTSSIDTTTTSTSISNNQENTAEFTSLNTTQSSRFFPTDYSPAYEVAFKYSLDSTLNAYKTKYRINFGKDLLRIYTEETPQWMHRPRKIQWLQAYKNIIGEAQSIGTVPGKHGERLVFKNNICTWVDPQSIDFGSIIEAPTAKKDCKSIYEIDSFYIDQTDHIVYVKEKESEKARPLEFNHKEIEADTLVALPESEGLIGIITHADTGHPLFLTVKSKAVTQPPVEIPASTQNTTTFTPQSTSSLSETTNSPIPLTSTQTSDTSLSHAAARTTTPGLPPTNPIKKSVKWSWPGFSNLWSSIKKFFIESWRKFSIWG